MIEYRDTHDFTQEELQDLFLSVDWSSGHFPEKLQRAMRGFSSVDSAWDGDTLVGLICAMDDGVMTAYIHYLLVRPEYQGAGVGKALVERMTARYADFLRIVLVAYDEEIGFYEACGFKKADHASPMFITELWT
jgi:ribosomal protein S18 acetylase RimI-like enzyme